MIKIIFELFEHFKAAAFILTKSRVSASMRKYYEMELERVRTMHAKEVTEVKKFGIASMCKDLLEVGDNLNLCVSSVDKINIDETSKVILEGVEMTDNVFHKVLKKYGVEKYDDVVNETVFDPYKHEALYQNPEVNKNVVASVERVGYKIEGRLLRASRVGVGSMIEERKRNVAESDVDMYKQ